jgi:protein-disulfide isomerase
MKRIVLALALIALVGCTGGNIKDQVAKVIKENPSIITDVIKENPSEFMAAFQSAIQQAQGDERKKQEEDEKKKLEAAFNSPLQPEIRSDEVIEGTKGAPLTLVEYSDFQCPYCSRANTTVKELLKKFEGKIQFVYKHLPLNFHPHAMMMSKYYEAARLQGAEKAIKLRHFFYENAKDIEKGEKFFKDAAKKVGLDMKKLEADLKSEVVAKRIEADQVEAQKFEFQGTPGFLLNGIPVRGAYPADHFVKIVEELKTKGKVTL